VRLKAHVGDLSFNRKIITTRRPRGEEGERREQEGLRKDGMRE